ncbi:hypothetical protein ACJMK2_015839 [Sinanodonta woodiana]|uniref:Peptidase M20 domain-containing protein 2 n=1 Tax=Sinanodonta woodiana TaxID=1069815 RepID=A0ABD3URR0_SINWO
MENLKAIACAEIERMSGDLRILSNEIWTHPELGMEETKAHNYLTGFLEERGLQVERSFKLKTAFRAVYGSADAGPNLAVMCEYDALPEIGHACGHNLIAEVGVAAGLGIMAAIKASPKAIGKVTILGTPAEEGYGGKIDLIKHGAFDDVDVAMMAHPFPSSDPTPVMLARETLVVSFHGRSSHAAAYPWEGVNALDAAVLCYQNIACLRQQIKPTWRIHAIFKKGGTKVNIIPEEAVLEVAVRAPTDAEYKQLRQKVVTCVEAAATATGCSMEYQTVDKPYSALVSNEILSRLYESNLASIHKDDGPSFRSGIYGSTDMGNVSRTVPSIHPHFYIGGIAVNHTRDFTIDAGYLILTITLLTLKAI